ncbi:MAG TPA: xylulokinase [Anaerolineales bacterium]|nr:xylulokinase [Anaerolineales bacterium]
MTCFLGIDAGTSGVKAIVIDEEGKTLGLGYKEVDLITPRPLWVEQNPSDWEIACDYAVKTAVASSGHGNEIEAVGLTGQMLGNTMLDKEMRPIGNCMIWLDQRATEERDCIEAALGIDAVLDITANDCLTGYWAPKLMWIKKHRPDIFEKTRMVLFPKDYLKYLLTGEANVEVTDASGSFLMDVGKRVWSDKMFEVCGLPKDIVPQHISESCDVIGYLKPEIASAYGMRPNIPVVGGAGDQPAGGIGNGVYKEGTVSATIGTSGVVYAATSKVIADRKRRAALCFCHSAPQTWSLFGCTLAAGGSFKWLRDTFFADQKADYSTTGGDVYELMTNLASQAQPSSEGLVFLPYLNGERTPYPDENARGVFFGLSYRHGLPEICRAVMEGVTYSLRDTIEILREFNVEIDEVRASGGGAKSELWRQMQADIYSAPVVTTNLTEGPSAGAAIMAAVGAGAYSSVGEACDSIVKIVSCTEPVAKNVRLYEEFFQTYRSLYPTLKETFAAQNALTHKWFEQ